MRTLIVSLWLIVTVGSIAVLIRLLATGLWRTHWGVSAFLMLAAIRTCIGAPFLLAESSRYATIWRQTQWLSDAGLLLLVVGTFIAVARVFPRPILPGAIVASSLAVLAWGGAHAVAAAGVSAWQTHTALLLVRSRNFAVGCLLLIAGAHLLGGLLHPLTRNLRRATFGAECFLAVKLLTYGLQQAASNDPRWNAATMAVFYLLSWIPVVCWWRLTPGDDVAPMIEHLPPDQIQREQAELVRRIRGGI